MLSADELVSAVRVHLDRVHDSVRRLGCPPGPAVEVVHASAEEQVERAARQELSVEQVVGGWFAAARRAGCLRTAPPGLPLGVGVLSGEADQERLSAALEDLPETECVALLLRDSYDLPSAAVSTALELDDDAALALVARARLAFLARYDDDLPLAGPGLVAPEHAELAALARLGEPRPVAARDATVRRHVLSCSACRAVVDEQTRAHLLLSGLVVAAVPDDARAEVLAAVDRRARELLPASPPVATERVLAAAHVDDLEPVRGLSPLLVVLSVVLAVLTGLGAGLLLSDSAEPEQLVGADGTLPPGVVLASSPPPPPSVLPSPPTVPEQRPDTDVVVLPPPPPPEPSPSPSPSPSPTPTAAPAAVTVTPESGPDGTPLTVSGTGFPAGGPVAVQYVGPAGPVGRADATAGADGTFSVPLVAADPAGGPGPHTVTATSGTVTATATFTVTG